MTTSHTKQRADSGDRLSKRASVFALLLMNIQQNAIDNEHCRYCGTYQLGGPQHTHLCIVSVIDRALDADATELDAIRAALIDGDAP